jgi:UPF0271 protein
MYIDLNCDLGETGINGVSAADEAIMPWITSANIACGLHAGDPAGISATIRLALQNGTGIGAHPGYPDREGFGRTRMMLGNQALEATLIYQVGALKSMTEFLGGRLNHVKPHGALYNEAAVDRDTADIIARTVRRIDPSLILYGLAGSRLAQAAESIRLPFASEVFADRAYQDDGTLVPRNIPGAVLNDTSLIVNRAIRMVIHQEVVTISGKVIPLKADTICIHGDHPSAPVIAEELSTAFMQKGITLMRFTAKQADY